MWIQTNQLPRPTCHRIKTIKGKKKLTNVILSGVEGSPKYSEKRKMNNEELRITYKHYDVCHHVGILRQCSDYEMFRRCST